MEGTTVFTTLTTLAAHAPGVHGFGWAFLLFPLFWILVFVLIFGIFGRRWRRAAWNGYGHHGYWSQPARTAETSLAERFAQGDIDEKEYRARLEVLRANAYPPQPPKG
jgi:putative membrane protein